MGIITALSRRAAAKKGWATRRKNKNKAAKAEEKARVDALAARKKEHKGDMPAQKGIPSKNAEAEGAALDPDTEGSFDVARGVGTKGERVSTGAGSRGGKIKILVLVILINCINLDIKVALTFSFFIITFIAKSSISFCLNLRF